MASPAGQEFMTSFKAFAESAKIDLLLNSNTTFDVNLSLKSSLLEDVLTTPARRNLFYDEQVTLHVILRTPSSLEFISALLPDLDLSIGAHATDAVPDGRGNAASASGKHDLTTTDFGASHNYEWIETDGQNFIVWKPTAAVPRPRVRLQRPAVYFTASLAPRKTPLRRPAENVGKSTLTSYEPLPANVLEPLGFDHLLSGKKAYLPETKITKVAPPSPTVNIQIRPVRGATKRAFPIVPALYTRLHCSPVGNAVIISLHIEIAQLITKPVSIEDVSIEVQDGDVESLSHWSWPVQARTGNEDVFLFRARPVDAPNNPSYVANLFINATLDVESDCKSRLIVRWQSQIDLSHVAKLPEYKWSRPLSSHSQPSRLSAQSQSNRPSSVDGHAGMQAEAAVVFNFVAPEKVLHGHEFSIDVQCINRSSRTRRFAVINLQHKKVLQTNARLSSFDEDVPGLAAQLLISPPPERLEPSDVLDANPEIRIGPLHAGSCYETRWTFRAMKKGVLDLGTFRIVDLDSMRTVDVKKLPTILSVDDVQLEATKKGNEYSLYKVHTPQEWTKSAPKFAVTAVKHRKNSKCDHTGSGS